MLTETLPRFLRYTRLHLRACNDGVEASRPSRDTTSVSRNEGSTSKGKSTQSAWQPIAQPEHFGNLRRGKALFIGSIGASRPTTS
jgi:hypothetical protein